ncbi:hypothetical protein N9K16_05875 [Alphaproteobacteria bacterium]|nr:hypothetical protein [Alphaproteobacteria bacterium]
MIRNLLFAALCCLVVAGCSQAKPKKYVSLANLAAFEKKAPTASCKTLGDWFFTTNGVIEGRYQSRAGIAEFMKNPSEGSLEKAMAKAKAHSALMKIAAQKTKISIDKNLASRCSGNKYMGWREKA